MDHRRCCDIPIALFMGPFQGSEHTNLLVRRQNRVGGKAVHFISGMLEGFNIHKPRFVGLRSACSSRCRCCTLHSRLLCHLAAHYSTARCRVPSDDDGEEEDGDDDDVAAARHGHCVRASGPNFTSNLRSYR